MIDNCLFRDRILVTKSHILKELHNDIIKQNIQIKAGDLQG